MRGGLGIHTRYRFTFPIQQDFILRGAAQTA